MRKGSVLVLVLEVILVTGALTISFLHMIEEEIVHINQIDPCTDFRAKSDSILAITVVNLHSYLEENCSLADCEERIRARVGENFGRDVSFVLSAEDSKIPLGPEFLNLLEQLFPAIGVSYQETRALICELEDFFTANKLDLTKPEQLLILPTFKNLFVGEDGFFTEKWRLFTENVTCQNTDAIALIGLSDELLGAICSLENWRFGDAKDALNRARFLNEDLQNFPFAELYARGCPVHNPGLFRGKNSCFRLTVTREIEGLKLTESYFIKHSPAHDFCGFPFEIIFLTNKF